MKKRLFTLTSTFAIILLSGCAVRPTQAVIYSNTTTPVNATNSTSGAKKGISDECVNILGIIATGDCSIQSAKENGKISKVSTVDWKGINFLGIYARGNTIITGDWYTLSPLQKEKKVEQLKNI